MCNSLWYNAPTILPAGSLEAEFHRFQATGRHCNGCNILQAVTQSSAPEDRQNNCPKHVEMIGIINKPLLLHLVRVYIIYINDARSNKYQINITLFGFSNLHACSTKKSSVKD